MAKPSCCSPPRRCRSSPPGRSAPGNRAPTPARQHWSFDGVFGTYDRAAAQRGFQVYKEVCSACHPLKHLSFRDLTDLGYTEDQVKGFAAQYEVTDGPNDQGQMYQRPARPSDPFVGPFPNDQAARAANNGALPPDLSLITKAREGGPDYVYAILNGFKEAPPGLQDGPGHVLQRGLPGASDRDAAAADRDGQVTIRRRDQGDGPADGA